MKKFLSLLWMTLFAVTAWGTEVTYTFGSNGYDIQSAETTVLDDFTFSFGGTWSVQNAQFRPNQNASLTIEGDGVVITGLKFTASSDGYALTEDGTTFTDGTNEIGTFSTSGPETTWTYSTGATKVVITNTTTQRRLKSVTITYTENGDTPPAVTVTPPWFSPDAGEVAAGTEVTITSDEGTTITYTTDGSDPTESSTALTVDGNEATVTVNEAMTIKAVAMDADANVSEVAEAAYTIKTAPVGDYVFYESFDGTDGTGGNDGDWSGTIATSTIVYDNEGWTVENAGGASKCIKLGTGSKAGSAETPAITLTSGQTYTLTFKAAGWNIAAEKTAVNLSATGATLSEESITLVKGAWTEYSVVLTATDASANIKWQAPNASNNRFFLDEVLLVEGGTMPVVKPAAPTFDPAAGEVEKGTVVTITGAEGTTITYTTDNSDPTESSTALTVDGNVATVTVNEAMTIKAVAMDADLVMSDVATAAYTIAAVTVAPPTFDPAAGKVVAGTVVTITGEEGTTITYTTDETDPTESSTALTVDGNVATVTVNETMTIKAVAMDADANISEVAEAAYTVRTMPTDCVFYESFDDTEGTGGNDGLWNGTIAEAEIVYDNSGWTVENAKGANQCIKLGTTSKAGSAETPAITLTSGQTYTLTFKAAAWNTSSEKTTINMSATGATLGEESITLVKGEWTEYSVVLTATDASANIKWQAPTAANNRFFLDEVKLVEGGTMPVVKPAAPTFDPAAGEVTKGTVVTISSAEGTTITYTTDGSDPTESNTALTVDGNVATVTINAAMTIKAVAVDANLVMSDVAEAAYTLAAVTVAPPTFDPAAGKVVAGTVVTITGEEGTTITYTTDGSDPTESNTALTVDGNVATVTVNEAMTIKAVAMDADANVSEVAEAAYTIKTVPVGDYVFYESFDETDGTGGNDGQWNGTIATNDIVFDNEGWTVENAGGASQCIKVGAGSKAGSAETPAITLEADKTYTLTFKAAAWNTSSEKTTINLSATGATLSEESISLVKGEWTEYSVIVAADDATANIKWQAPNASNNRFFLDEVLLVEGGTMPVVKPAAPTFNPAAGEVEKGTVVTITGAEGTTITYTIDNSDPTESSTALTVDGNVATVTVNEAMTIKAVAVNADLVMSDVATAAYTIAAVTVAPPTFSPAAGKVVAGTVVTITGAEGTTITYTTDETDPTESSTALTVDGNVATVTVDEAMTIKAVAMDADANVSEIAEAAYTIKTLPVGDYVFYESFDNTQGSGGNDDLWSGNIASSDITCDNEGWTLENAGGANECIKLGTSKKAGFAETPAIALTSGNTYTLTFKAAAWVHDNEKTTITLSATGATLDADTITLAKGEWTDFTVTVTAIEATANIKWEAIVAANNRFFLDEVLLVAEEKPHFEQGDVNGDGVVSGADVTALYNVLLDGTEAGGDADVNGDGIVNGSDVTALYNILLN